MQERMYHIVKEFKSSLLINSRLPKLIATGGRRAFVSMMCCKRAPLTPGQNVGTLEKKQVLFCAVRIFVKKFVYNFTFLYSLTGLRYVRS